jgi:hypothetical protein
LKHLIQRVGQTHVGLTFAGVGVESLMIIPVLG